LYSLADDRLHQRVISHLLYAIYAVYAIDKKYILWTTFPLQKVLVYLQPLLRNPSRKLPNLVKLRSGYGYYAVQGHSRSPILVQIESSCATS